MSDQASVTAQGLRPRAATRHKLFEPVLLRQGGVAVRAHMLDLSVTGALLHAERPPVIGARVTIHAEGAGAAARVIWVRAKRFGLRFDMPLADATIGLLLRGGRTTRD